MNAARCALTLVLWLAWSQAAGETSQPRPARSTTGTAEPPQPPPELRRVTVERSHQGHSATGTVILRQIPPTAAPSPHLRLAGSRAWLALAGQRQEAQDWAGALTCARAGLDELGRRYAARGVIDDTSLKLGAAEEQLKKGNIQAASEVTLRILTTRTRLYLRLHAEEITE